MSSDGYEDSGLGKTRSRAEMGGSAAASSSRAFGDRLGPRACVLRGRIAPQSWRQFDAILLSQQFHVSDIFLGRLIPIGVAKYLGGR